MGYSIEIGIHCWRVSYIFAHPRTEINNLYTVQHADISIQKYAGEYRKFAMVYPLPPPPPPPPPPPQKKIQPWSEMTKKFDWLIDWLTVLDQHHNFHFRLTGSTLDPYLCQVMQEAAPPTRYCTPVLTPPTSRPFAATSCPFVSVLFQLVTSVKTSETNYCCNTENQSINAGHI